MKVTVKQEFSIFSLFTDDFPYGLEVNEDTLARAINKEFEDYDVQYKQLKPFTHVKVLTTDDCGLSRWLLETKKDYNEEPVFYPKKRVYTAAEARKAIPAAIRRVLERLDKQTFDLKGEDDAG